MAMNIGSRRVIEKIGMKYVRTVPFDAAHFPGSEQGEVWYELTRSEWAAS
jgi:RimJ/RimL family protein N-acetyltransferase